MFCKNLLFISMEDTSQKKNYFRQLNYIGVKYLQYLHLIEINK